MKDYTKLLTLIEDIKRIGAECTDNEREFVYKMIADVLKNTLNGERAVVSVEQSSESEVMVRRRGRPKKNESVAEPPKVKSKRGRKKKSSADDSALVSLLAGKPNMENIRGFLETTGLPEAAIHSLFAVSEEKVERRYTSLGTDKKAQAQVNAVMLSCLANAIVSGRFIADLRQVREDCRALEAYDSNFTNNIKRHDAQIQFLSGDFVELTEAGKNELAQLVRTLSQTGA
mgnify:CR=1 FL=1